MINTMEKQARIAELEEVIAEGKIVLNRMIELHQGDLSELSDDFKVLDDLITQHFKLKLGII